MLCPKCQREVPPGTIFCPYCMTEIPWVKEFDSVEILTRKKKAEEDRKEKEDDHSEENRPLPFDSEYPGLDHFEVIRKLLKRKWLVFYLVMGIVCVFLIYSRSHSFSALYEKSGDYLYRQEFGEAINYIQQALEIEPHSVEANIRLADILDQQGQWEDALLVLRPMLKASPGNASLLRKICDILYREGQFTALKEVLGEASESAVAYCQDYISTEPVASHVSGTYTQALQIYLSTEEAFICYTLDSLDPCVSGKKYTSPIHLSHGSYILKAVSFNHKGIPSDIAEWKYVVVQEVPDPPSVTPASGIYHTPTKIEIQVPDGCKAYYAFDEVPTESSTEYQQPITMPMYSHTLYAILVAANGLTSEPTVVDYYLEY